jgi:hypothetical protein
MQIISIIIIVIIIIIIMLTVISSIIVIITPTIIVIIIIIICTQILLHILFVILSFGNLSLVFAGHYYLNSGFSYQQYTKEATMVNIQYNTVQRSIHGRMFFLCSYIL